MAGVKIGFQASGFTGQTPPPGPKKMRLFHLPPVHLAEEFQESMEDITDLVGPKPMVMLLETGNQLRDETMSRLISATSRFSPSEICILRLYVRAPGGLPADLRFFDLGSLPDWSATVADRIPTVIRTPDSVLSRAYLSICESLLCKITQTRRLADASRTVHASTGR
jgi:hypothetical protein